MYIANLSSLLSFKGLIVSSILIIVYLIIRDYTQWRSMKKSKQDNTQNETTSINAKIKEDLAENTSGHDSAQKDSLSIGHYILVTPFAAVYIIGRAIVDSIKYSLYYTLWTIEQSLPYLDDWLFDMVTVTLPAKSQQIDTWWKESGYPACKHFKTHLSEHTLPMMIHILETFFIKTFTLCSNIYTAISKFILFSRDFMQRPEWHELGVHLYESAYNVLWSPSVWIVTRSITLGGVIYRGCYAAFLSLKEDTVWLFYDIIPRVYHYLASTRIVQAGVFVVMFVQEKVMTVVYSTKDVLSPLIEHILSLLVKGIDKLIMLAQKHGHFFTNASRRVYRYMSPQIVYVMMELAVLTHDSLNGIDMLLSQLVVPTYRLFMKHVLPKLSAAYVEVRSRVVAACQVYISPALLFVYPYAVLLWQWLYVKMATPLSVVSQFMYKMLMGVGSHMLILTHKLSSVAMSQLMTCVSYSQSVYLWANAWLMKQAPLLTDLLQKIWTMMASYEWNSMIHEGWATLSLFEEWISVEANTIYASLERSLNIWAVEQGVKEGKKGLEEKSM